MPAPTSARVQIEADVARRIRSIRRADGRIDDFNPSKIERSIQSAFASAGLMPTDESKRIRRIAERVIDRLGQLFEPSRPPSTVDVRELVLLTLKESALPAVELEYIKFQRRKPKSSVVATPMTPQPSPTMPPVAPPMPPAPAPTPAAIPPKPVVAEAPKPSFDPYAARRRRLPDERKSLTHKFDIGNHQGYITVGLYEDGTPGEIFLRMGRESGAISAIVDAFAMSVSLGLQYGVPLKTLVSKFAHMRFEPAGATKNPNIPNASSIVDYIFRWMSLKFLTSEERHALGIHGEPGMPEGLGMNLGEKSDRQSSIV